MQGPSVPSPTATAAAQTASNQATARSQTELNAVNQNTPTGSLNYSQTGTFADGTPQFTANTTLAPAQQAIFNAQQGTNQNLANTAQTQSAKLSSQLGNPDLSGVSALGNPASVSAGPIQTSLTGDNGLQARNDAQAALMARLQPTLDQQQNSLNQNLANQGVKVGSQAYSQAQRVQGQNQNDANLAAITQAGTEQSLQQGLALNSGNFANAAQQQQYGQSNQNFANQNTANQLGMTNAYAAQNNPLNQDLALAGQGQIGSPSFQTTPNTGVQGTDVAGIQNTAYNQALGQTQATNSAIGSIGSTVGGWLFSSPSLKTDVHDTGAKTKDGIPLKTFRYKGSPMMQMGVMADDAKAKRPDAVRKVGRVSQVNYDRIGSPMLSLGRKAG